MFDSRIAPYLLLAGVFFGFFFQLGSVPLFDLDEGAFSEATREMLMRGDFLTTYLNGELRFDKPILIYWLQAASVSLLGLNEFALRLPSALSATLWVGTLYLFARRFYDARTAFAAAFMLATTLQITIIAKAAIADALLNLFIAASMFALYRYHVERERRWLYALFALIGLGMLAKGPVAALIPLAVSFLFYALRRDLAFWLRSVFNPVGILIFLAVAGPWYALEYLEQGQKFVDGFLLRHNVGRFNAGMEGHTGSLLYFVPVLLVGLLPYTTLLLRTLRDVRAWFADDLERFLGIWFLFVFVFFSFSGTKLPHYVIYGYTPLFILMARRIALLRSDAWLVLPPALLFALLLFLPEIATAVQPSVRDAFARLVIETAPAEFGPGYRLYFVAALAAFGFLAFAPRLPRGAKLAVMGLITAVGINGFVIPTYGRVAQQPVKDAALYAKAHGLDVVTYRLNMPSFLVYRESLSDKRRPEPGETVFTKRPRLEELGAHEVLFERHGIVLARMRSEAVAAASSGAE